MGQELVPGLVLELALMSVSELELPLLE